MELSIFGIKFGKRKLLGDKTWAGFIAGAVVGVLVCFVTTQIIYHMPLNIWFLIFSGISVGLVESLSWKIEDNFSIPVFSGFILTLLAKFFEIA